MISTLNGAVRRLEYVWDRPDNDDSTDGHKLTLIWLVVSDLLALAVQGPYVCFSGNLLLFNTQVILEAPIGQNLPPDCPDNDH